MKLLKVMSFVIAFFMATAIAPKALAQSANSGAATHTQQETQAKQETQAQQQRRTHSQG